MTNSSPDAGSGCRPAPWPASPLGLPVVPAFAQGRIGLRGENRIALVIGNGSYAQAPLQNPVSDARAVSAALRELGFEVLHRENASMEEMLDTMREFISRSRDAQVRVVYYAGTARN